MSFDSPAARTGALALAGAATIAVGAQIAVPMVPVPTTLQTLAVIAVALLAGPRVGALGAALYLAGVLLGLPILSGGQSYGGLAFLEMRSAGYVVGFVPAAAVAGVLGTRQGILWLLLAGVSAHLVVFAFGLPVMAWWLGPADAIVKGFNPFVLGALTKSLVAAMVVGSWRVARPQHAGQAT